MFGTAARRATGLILIGALLFGTGCGRYTVYFVYPEERANYFNERPQTSIYVAEPEDLRPSKETNGSGTFGTLRFPSDDHLDIPATTMIRRSLMQDLLTTRVAKLVHNPDNADYVLNTQVLSMTTILHRKATQYAIPMLIGVAIGAAFGSDTGDAVKLGLVGFVLGTFIPLPTKAEGNVELRLELLDSDTNEMVWSANCIGNEEDKVYMSLSAREDKKLAERYLPRSMKRANACAVGQMHLYLQTVETPEGDLEPDPTSG